MDVNEIEKMIARLRTGETETLKDYELADIIDALKELKSYKSFGTIAEWADLKSGKNTILPAEVAEKIQDYCKACSPNDDGCKYCVFLDGKRCTLFHDSKGWPSDWKIGER